MFLVFRKANGKDFLIKLYFSAYTSNSHCMKEQNFKNHTRLVPSYHFILLAVVLAIDILAVIHLISALKNNGNLLEPVMFILIATALTVGSLLLRTFPLIAQDRTIRAEENLRHFILTGKRLNSDLTLSQIIALRFAPDDEFGDLAELTVRENLSNRAIKKAIKQWKADYHRV
jgi:hypothetical protein